MKSSYTREFGDPDLHYVETPVYSKKSASRESESIPVQLPSTIFAREYEGHVDPVSSSEPDDSSSNFDCEAWRSSVVRRSADKHWSRIIPVAFYMDGVQYGIRESFEGMYIRNLRTGIQYLVAILRYILSCKTH